MSVTRSELAALGYTVHNGEATRVVPAVQAATPNAATRSPYRSQWEEDRAATLATWQEAGLLKAYRYQGIRLRLAGRAWYTPDFVIWHNDGHIELEEVKGYWREAAKVRWRVAVEAFPMFAFSLTTKVRGYWVVTEFHPVAQGGANGNA